MVVVVCSPEKIVDRFLNLESSPKKKLSLLLNDSFWADSKCFFPFFYLIINFNFVFVCDSINENALCLQIEHQFLLHWIVCYEAGRGNLVMESFLDGALSHSISCIFSSVLLVRLIAYFGCSFLVGNI